jgi:hypothetical protein
LPNLNPGSAGPRRLSLPIGLAGIEVAEDGLKPKIEVLFEPSYPPADHYR